MNVPLTVANRYQLKAHADRSTITLSQDLKVGEVVVVGVCPVYCEPMFGVIRECKNSVDTGTILSCQLYESHFDSHYHAYTLDFMSSEILEVKSDKLMYKLPVSHVRTKLNIQQFCIWHSVV